MTPDNQDAYRSFTRQHPELPLFFRDWFLDAVCQDGTWGAALESNGQGIHAVMPYYLKRKGPFRYITMPPLCKMLGPWLLPAYHTLEHEHRLFGSLAAQLPKTDHFEQDFHYSVTNWLPFYWKGYRQTTRYTYLLHGIDDLQAVYSRLYRSYRNNAIPKAADTVEIRHDLPLEAFYEVNKMSFTRQGRQVPYSLGFVRSMDAALAAHNARQLFFAVDARERIHSVFYLVWDNQSAYCHMLGDDPGMRQSGSGIYLTWKAIEYASTVLKIKTFDFEGSMIQPIEHVRRNFGAVQQPYFHLSRTDAALFRALRYLRR